MTSKSSPKQNGRKTDMSVSDSPTLSPSRLLSSPLTSNTAAVGKLEIRPAALRDVLEIGPLIRQADRREIIAATLQDPQLMVLDAFWRSRTTWAGTEDGKVICL